MSQLYAKENNISITKAREIIQSTANFNSLKVLVDNPGDSITLFFKNIKNENIKIHSSFVTNLLLKDLTYYSNRFFYFCFVVVTIYFIYLAALKKIPNYFLPVLTILFLIIILTILESGLSFWQGDRLLLINVPLILVFFAVAISLTGRVDSN